MNRLKEKLHRVKQHWKQTRGALVTESTFVYPIMFFIVFFMIFFGNMFCIRAGIDQLVTEEAIESAARYADPSLAECEDGIATTLEDAPRVTKNLYRYLDVFDLGGSQSVSTGNIKEGDGTYTGFFSGMNADNIEVVKHHVNNYIVYQTYEVEVHYKLKFPWKFIFNDERIYIPMIARAEVPVTDSAEFIRNVDMAIDMFERSEGGEDFFANADIIYGKVQDFLNGENANGEAVAGGIRYDSDELLDDSGKFLDSDLEKRYQNYVERKKREGKEYRDRLDWKQASDYWTRQSPVARGNRFNNTVNSARIYQYSEINLENGKRLDSYDYNEKTGNWEIISRKATDLDKISETQFRSYLKEIGEKYSVGTQIRTNKYREIDGTELKGIYILEIPASNQDLPNIKYFEEIAREYDVTLRYTEEE